MSTTTGAGKHLAGEGRPPAQVALAGLAALAVAMGIGRFAFTPILPMMQDAGLSIAAGGWLASANYIGYLLGSLLAIVVDSSPVAAIRWGLAITTLATVAMGMTDAFYAWLFLRAVAGVASAVVLVFCSAWCMERLASLGRSSLNGVLFSGVGTGIMAAGAVCLVLIHLHADYVHAWWSLGIVAAVFTAAIWGAFSGGQRHVSQRHSRDEMDGPRMGADSIRLILCYGAFGYGYIIPATFLPAMARSMIADPTVFAWAWPVFGFAAALSTLLASRVRGRFNDRGLWAGCHLVMAAGVVMPLLWPGIAAILCSALCVGGTTMVITMAGMQEARRVAGAHARALIAAMTSAFAVGQIAGPLTVSYLIGRPGGFSQAVLVAGGILVASAVALAVPSARR